MEVRCSENEKLFDVEASWGSGLKRKKPSSLLALPRQGQVLPCVLDVIAGAKLFFVYIHLLKLFNNIIVADFHANNACVFFSLRFDAAHRPNCKLKSHELICFFFRGTGMTPVKLWKRDLKSSLYTARLWSTWSYPELSKKYFGASITQRNERVNFSLILTWKTFWFVASFLPWRRLLAETEGSLTWRLDWFWRDDRGCWLTCSNRAQTAIATRREPGVPCGCCCLTRVPGMGGSPRLAQEGQFVVHAACAHHLTLALVGQVPQNSVDRRDLERRRANYELSRRWTCKTHLLC